MGVACIYLAQGKESIRAVWPVKVKRLTNLRVDCRVKRYAFMGQYIDNLSVCIIAGLILLLPKDKPSTPAASLPPPPVTAIYVVNLPAVNVKYDGNVGEW